jgi:hypothetical protein
MDLELAWEEFLEKTGSDYTDMRDCINDFANIHANSYDEYLAIWETLERAYCRNDLI